MIKCAKCNIVIKKNGSVIHWLRNNITNLCEDCFDLYESSPDSTTKLTDFLRMNKQEWKNRNRSLKSNFFLSKPEESQLKDISLDEFEESLIKLIDPN